MKISIVVPIYNEDESVVYLCKKLSSVLVNIACGFEVILVNDGSTDKTAIFLDNISEKDNLFKVIPQMLGVPLLRSNC